MGTLVFLVSCSCRQVMTSCSRAEHLRKAESRGNSLYRSVRSTTLHPSGTTTLNPSTPKDSQSQSRVMAEYTKIEALQEEKIQLAEKLRRIVTRHRERARDEWRKIVGDEVVSSWDAAQEEEVARGEVGLGAIAWQVGRLSSSGSVGSLVSQLVQKGGLGSGGGSPLIDEKVVKSTFFLLSGFRLGTWLTACRTESGSRNTGVRLLYSTYKLTRRRIRKPGISNLFPAPPRDSLHTPNSNTQPEQKVPSYRERDTRRFCGIRGGAAGSWAGGGGGGAGCTGCGRYAVLFLSGKIARADDWV